MNLTAFSNKRSSIKISNDMSGVGGRCDATHVFGMRGHNGKFSEHALEV